jgi:hypothetical protein
MKKGYSKIYPFKKLFREVKAPPIEPTTTLGKIKFGWIQLSLAEKTLVIVGTVFIISKLRKL